MESFQTLCREVLDFIWRFSPVSATFVGVHDFDSELDDISRDFILQGIAEHKALLAKLEQVDPRALSGPERIDHQLLQNSLRAAARGLEEYRLWEKDPAGPVQLGLYGVFVLALRDFAPLEQRAEAMLSRLRQVPRAIAQGRANLRDSPAVFTNTAVGVTRGGISFYQDFVPQFADQVPALKSRILDACRKAAEACGEYLKFLTDDYLSRSSGSFATGPELFDFMLRTGNGLPYSADDLLEIGRDVLQSTQDQLATLASEIAPGRYWWEIVAELKREHPSGAELMDAYRSEMQRARDFTREHGLVTFPEGEELELIWTPAFERSTIPYAAYMAPAPFESRQQGFFYVTPLNSQLPPEKQEEQLQGHSRHKIPVTALHEAYPGHHLQLVLSNRVGSQVRKLLGTSVFAEGWALYCEEMMFEQGFYTDPRVRLMQLKDQVWRACRVLIDVGLHTQGMTYQQAVDMLVERARVERVNAEIEVNRYCGTPTQPMSYIIGKHQMMNLRREYESQQGAKFNLREFHDQLLSFGTIPVAIVRQEMLGQSVVSK
jgi:uncharacterized protein (DUF885 family)